MIDVIVQFEAGTDFAKVYPKTGRAGNWLRDFIEDRYLLSTHGYYKLPSYLAMETGFVIQSDGLGVTFHGRPVRTSQRKAR